MTLEEGEDDEDNEEEEIVVKSETSTTSTTGLLLKSRRTPIAILLVSRWLERPRFSTGIDAHWRKDGKGESD
jgi:hypothetical protein